MQPYTKIVNNDFFDNKYSQVTLHDPSRQSMVVHFKNGEKIKVKNHFIEAVTEQFSKCRKFGPTLTKAIKEHYKNVFSSFSKSTPKNEDLIKTYLKLTSIVAAKKKEAEAYGKPLLILMGENHSSREALILELMILSILKDLGITNFLIELDQENLKSYIGLNETSLNKLKDHALSFLFNFHFYLNYAKSKQMAVLPSDPLHQFDHIPAARNAAINYAILNMNRNCSGIFGLAHLNHIMCDSKMQKYMILPLALGEKIRELPIPAAALQVNVEGDSNVYMLSVNEMIDAVHKIRILTHYIYNVQALCEVAKKYFPNKIPSLI